MQTGQDRENYLTEGGGDEQDNNLPLVGCFKHCKLSEAVCPDKYGTYQPEGGSDKQGRECRWQTVSVQDREILQTEVLYA